jgi:hypothetical protein
MWQVTPTPPQLIRPLQEFVPEQTSVVLVALTYGPLGHDPSPLQMTVQ